MADMGTKEAAEGISNIIEKKGIPREEISVVYLADDRAGEEAHSWRSGKYVDRVYR